MNLKNILNVIGTVLIVAGAGLAPYFYFQTGSLGWDAPWVIPAAIGAVLLVVASTLGSREDKEAFRELDELEEIIDRELEQNTGIRTGEDPSGVLLGTGTVQSVERTSWTINDIPQFRVNLRVRGADMQEFTGHMKVLLMPHEMSAFSPGTIVPVAYRAKKPSRLFTVPEDRREEAQELIYRQHVQLGLVDPRAADVYRRGVPVTGVVMSTTPTGEIRHGYTRMETVLRFTNPHGVMVERSKGMFVPPSALEQVGVGRQVNLRVLPEDDTQLVLELATGGS